MRYLKVSISVLLLLFGISVDAAQNAVSQPVCDPIRDTVAVTFLFAPESSYYTEMDGIIDQFEQASCSNGIPINPSTGEEIEFNIQVIPVRVRSTTGELVTEFDPSDRELTQNSGFVADAIVNSLAPDSQFRNSDVPAISEIPVLWQPSISRWLQLVNFRSGQPIYSLDSVLSTTREPSVIAIWEPYYQALVNRFGESIGWEQLLAVSESPNGWCDFGIPVDTCRRAVFYGHTNPFLSSTALDMLLAQYYAAARITGTATLTLAQVNDEMVRNGVRQIQNMARHYSPTTVVFRNYLTLGSDYIDFVAYDENSLIGLNRNATGNVPALRAIYPREGTFVQDRPLAIANVSTISLEQRIAANIFSNFVITRPIQEFIMSRGFRPFDQTITLDDSFFAGCPITDCGVTRGDFTVLTPPLPRDLEVVHQVQLSWGSPRSAPNESIVRRQAEILILLDISGSMIEQQNNISKLDAAKDAAINLIQYLELNNPNAILRLITFNSRVYVSETRGQVRDVADQLMTEINNITLPLEAASIMNDTALYQAVQTAVTQLGLVDGNTIRAVILLSDGRETASNSPGKSSAISAITDTWQTKLPVFVLPVAYGVNADLGALGDIGNASFILDGNRSYFQGDVGTIRDLLSQLARYF